MTFGGSTFDAARDGERLSKLLDRVRIFMSDGQWRIIPQIREQVGGTESSVSARLRDLRKQKHGGHCVEKEYIGAGLWQYRLLLEEENDSTARAKPMQFTHADMQICCEILYRILSVFEVSAEEYKSLRRLHCWMRTSCENK